MALPNLAKMDTLADRVAVEILMELTRRRQSQAALARALNVTPMWVSERLSGKTQLTLNDLDRIASALGVSVLDLFPGRRREPTLTDPLAPRVISGPGAPDRRRPRPGRPPQRPIEVRAATGPGRRRQAVLA